MHVQEMQRDIFAFNRWGNCGFIRILHDSFSLRCAAHFADRFACEDCRLMRKGRLFTILVSLSHIESNGR